jgi:hypothetical protein
MSWLPETLEGSPDAEFPNKPDSQVKVREIMEF